MAFQRMKMRLFLFGQAGLSLEELIIEQGLPAYHGYLPSVDENETYLGFGFKGIAITNKQRRVLTLFNGTESVGDTKNFSGHNSDRL